jgi:hypothetical protein
MNTHPDRLEAVGFRDARFPLPSCAPAEAGRKRDLLPLLPAPFRTPDLEADRATRV